MNRKYDRFNRAGVIVCILCGHHTRETGQNETDLEMCAPCIDMCVAENRLNDTDTPEPGQVEEYRKLVAQSAERASRNGHKPYVAQH